MGESRDLVEQLTAKHGEQYRQLIVHAIAFLDEREPTWGLSEPINRSDLIANLIKGIPVNAGE